MNVCAGSLHQRLEQIANQSENGTEPRDSADEANDGQTFKDVLTDTLSLGGRGQGEGKSAIAVRISPTSNHTRRRFPMRLKIDPPSKWRRKVGIQGLCRIIPHSGASRPERSSELAAA